MCLTFTYSVRKKMSYSISYWRLVDTDDTAE